MSEKIGRHKGAVETLLHEKKELSRILQIVNSQLERHLQELEDAGVDTDAFIDSLLEEENQDGRNQRRGGNQRSENRSSNQGGSRDSRGSNRSSSSQNQNSGNRGGSSSSDRDFSPSR